MTFLHASLWKTIFFMWLFDAQHQKTYLRTWAPIEDTNQPAHPCCLIRIFVVSMEKLGILGYPKYALWRFWSDRVNAQADLNLRWAHMFEGTFSDVAVYLCLPDKYMLVFMHFWCLRNNEYLRLPNTYSAMGKFSRGQIDDIFFIDFSQKIGFYISCKLSTRQFARNVKSFFKEKIRKIFQNVVCWLFFYPACFCKR